MPEFHTSTGVSPDAATFPARPEVVVYFGDDPLRAYQLRQWLPVLEVLHRSHPTVVVLRDRASLDLIRPATTLPIAFLPTFGELTDYYRSADPKVAVYVNNSQKNFQSLVARSVLHVHVNHGESDKICMVSNQVKAYDQVFVAGDAAVARHRAALIGFDEAALVPVGRPQLDLRPAPVLTPTARRTLLYAPTWEGEEPSNNYTSVDVMGPDVIAALLAVPDARVVYKPHPRVLTSTTPATVSAHHAIVAALEDAASRDPRAGHRYLPDADIFAVFPGCDAMVTDVSSVGIDFLYLHADRPVVLTDRYADPERLRAAAPISRCADVVVPGEAGTLIALLTERLGDDVHHAGRAAMRRFYFGDREVGESTRDFVGRIGAAIALRDRQVAARASSASASAAAALGAPGSLGGHTHVGQVPHQRDGEGHRPSEAGPYGDGTPLQAVILAAGLGTRLGMPFPKPLTPLSDGRSILAQQLDNLTTGFGNAVRPTVVLGFRPDLIMAAAPDVSYVFNERFERTNTSKSLLKALKASAPGGVLWLNGDVVFDAGLLDVIAEHIAAERSFVCVNTAAVGEEEVKYLVDRDGFVTVLSKTVADGLGEAVGINYIAARDKAMLIEHLEGCADHDYFERGIETAIAAGLKVLPVDISAFFVVEVDFSADLERANQEVSKSVTPAA